MSKQVTTEDFIQNAQKVHGDRYDYSKVNYIRAIQPVTITCKQHGDFLQRPSNHLTGRGCRKCGGSAPVTYDEFIKRANAVHGDRYDYSEVSFSSVETKIAIRCREHGIFHQRLLSHLKGFNCPKCGRVSTAEKLGHDFSRFFDDARRTHGNKYDYSKVVYVNALSKVIIVCPKHGDFDQKPASHIRGIGCPRCGDESAAALRVRTTEDYIAEAKTVHGNKYDYSCCVYKTMHHKVEIICPDHGSFMVLASNHVKGNQSGCPDCAESGFNPSLPGLLYYIAVKTDNAQTLYKIGITNLSVHRRFPTVDRERIRVVRLWHFDVGADAASREREVLKEFERFKYNGPKVLVGAGDSELFTNDVLGLDNVAEPNLPDDLRIFEKKQVDFNL